MRPWTSEPAFTDGTSSRCRPNFFVGDETLSDSCPVPFYLLAEPRVMVEVMLNECRSIFFRIAVIPCAICAQPPLGDQDLRFTCHKTSVGAEMPTSSVLVSTVERVAAPLNVGEVCRVLDPRVFTGCFNFPQRSQNPDCPKAGRSGARILKAETHASALCSRIIAYESSSVRKPGKACPSVRRKTLHASNKEVTQRETPPNNKIRTTMSQIGRWL